MASYWVEEKVGELVAALSVEELLVEALLVVGLSVEELLVEALMVVGLSVEET